MVEISEAVKCRVINLVSTFFTTRSEHGLLAAMNGNIGRRKQETDDISVAICSQGKVKLPLPGIHSVRYTYIKNVRRSPFSSCTNADWMPS